MHSDEEDNFICLLRFGTDNDIRYEQRLSSDEIALCYMWFQDIDIVTEKQFYDEYCLVDDQDFGAMNVRQLTYELKEATVLGNQKRVDILQNEIQYRVQQKEHTSKLLEKLSPKFIKVKDVNGVESGIDGGNLLFWVDDSRYFSIQTDQAFVQETYYWADENMLLEEESFTEAPIILSIIKSLNFELQYIRIESKNELAITGVALNKESLKQYEIPLLRTQAVELFYLARVPIYLHKSLIKRNSKRDNSKLPGKTSVDTDSQVDFELEDKSVGAEFVSDFDGQNSTSSRPKRKKKLTAKERFNNRKIRKKMKPDELKELLEEFLSEENYEGAAQVRDQLGENPED